MSRHPKRPRLYAEPTESEDYAREIVRLLAKTLNAAGHSKERLVRIMIDVVRTLKEPEHSPSPPRPDFVVLLPHVIALWHSHPRYLSRGKPRPLPFTARRACVREIIASVYPQMDPKTVLDALLKSGDLIRDGARYSPTSREVLFRHDRASGRIHALVSLHGLLLAIDENLSHRRRRVVQRAAFQTHFPVSDFDAFVERAKEVAEVLHPVDDFLRRRSVKKSSKMPTALAGIGIHAIWIPRARRAALRPRMGKAAR